MQNSAHRTNLRAEFEEMCLLAAIASAHALIGGLATAAIGTGLDLDGVQRTILLVSAMEGTAGHAAADIGVRLFLRHENLLLKNNLLKFSTLILPGI